MRAANSCSRKYHVFVVFLSLHSVPLLLCVLLKVFQRRVNGSVDFYRNWTSYKKGFGQLNHEFWLGNEILHHLTNQSSFELRVDVVNIHGNPFYSCYENFAIGDETSKYMLTISGWLGGIPGEYELLVYTFS